MMPEIGRLKGRGRCWDRDNAESILALACLDSNSAWPQYRLSQNPGSNYPGLIVARHIQAGRCGFLGLS